MTAPPHLSHSQIDTVLKCGEQYRLERIYRAPRTPAWYFIGGSVVHVVTEMIDVGFDDLNEVTPDWIENACARQFDDLVEDEYFKSGIDPVDWRAGGRGGSEDASWWHVEAPKMVQRWVDFLREGNLKVANIDKKRAVELEFVSHYGGVRFKGGIDRVLLGRDTNERVIVDLKTGRSEPTSPFQLAHYRDALRECHGIDVRWAYYWMARTGKLSKPFDLDLIDDETMTQRVTVAHTLISEGLFTPNPSPLCSSCGVKRWCSAFGGTTFEFEELVDSAND